MTKAERRRLASNRRKRPDKAFVCVTPELFARLKAEAAKRGVSMRYLVERALGDVGVQ